MQLSVIGLNHNTAPVGIRENMAVDEAHLSEKYAALLADSRISEAMIISTCNRVEYYLVTKQDCVPADVLYIVAACIGTGAQLLHKHTYIHCGCDAVNHLVMVASGIDSLVLGEPQIFGQVKESFRSAREHGGLGPYLNRLEQFALKTTKKVRTDTGISESAVSVSYAAVALAKKIFGALDSKKALIVGAGEMCELAAEHLEGANIGQITVTNRTFSKAEDLARRFRGKAVAFDQFAPVLHDTDIVFSSTGAPTAVVTYDMVKAAMKGRKSPMFLIDIAVPRDIEAEIGKIENVYLYDIDDLKQVVEAGKRERESEAVKAKELIRGAVYHFERSMASLRADPLIVELKERFETTTKEALSQYVKKHKIDGGQTAVLEGLLEAATAKLLHPPVKNLKAYFADDKTYTLEEAVTLLFNLGEKGGK